MENHENNKIQPHQNEKMDQGTGTNPKVRNQHEGKTQTPDDIENNKSGLGGMFDKGESQGQDGASPGTSTADELEERDSDTPVDDDEEQNLENPRRS